MSEYETEGTANEINITDVNAKIPRSVHFDRVTAKVVSGMLLVFVMCLTGNVWIIFGDIRNSQIRDILRREGSMAYAEVTKNSANRDGINLGYRFSVDGTFYLGHAEMKANHYIVPGVGDKISIRYLPKDPRVNQPVDWEWFSLWDIAPSLFVLLIMVVAALPITVTLRERTLARLGVVVRGRVTGCAPNQKLFKVYYEFTTQESTAMEGSTDSADEYEVGAPISVIYLRNNPKRNDRYPIAGFRIAN